MPAPAAPPGRIAPLEIDPEEFRRLGHALVDRIASLVASLPDRPVTPGEPPARIREVLGGGSLPAAGTDPGPLLERAADLLAEHSLYNGHPRFFGYVTAGPAPVGILGELLAAAVNPNVGAWGLSPVASEVEAQTVRWIAEMIGFPAGCGGLLVSGGTAANVVGLLAARRARAGWDVRTEGLRGGPPLTLYASPEVHTWLKKAADLHGFGTDAVREVAADADGRLDVAALRRTLEADAAGGARPLAVVASAGTVSTGTVDPIGALADLCRERGIWLHVDGAYGGLAAVLPDAPDDLKALSRADSVAVDPHKWLYSPLDAGCALVRDSAHLPAAFSYRPPYYRFEDEERAGGTNYYEHGMENSRSFRALKVWLALQHAGRDGYARMIGDDVALARALFEAVSRHAELEARTRHLSIATFRYVPPRLAGRRAESREELNELNAELLARLQQGGEAYVSNAVAGGDFLLRACIVNFRTALADVEALPGIVVRLGRQLEQERGGAGAG